MKRILFVDDEKDPKWFDLDPTQIHRSTSYDSALDLIRKNVYDIIYIDHDLGDKYRDGSHLITEYGLMKKPIEKVCCISWNSAGIRRIVAACHDFGIPCEVHGQKVFNRFEIIDGQSG
jgi:hypothetical protein